MINKINKLLLRTFAALRKLIGGSDFGYISYSTTNIGDDIQALAAKRFLPKNSLPIDRDFIHDFKHPRQVHTIVNGWFMHTKERWKGRAVGPNDYKEPNESWPPAKEIDPLLISIHITKEFAPLAFSEESIEYLKSYGPVGARDFNTLKLLEEHGIPSYYSGCLTLTLDEKYKSKERNKYIYCVDIPADCVKYIRENSTSEVIEISHKVPEEYIRDNEIRLAYAENILRKYGKAQCVITARLHAALPCLALETPVLFLTFGPDNRFGGTETILRTCSKANLLSGNYDFNFDTPTPNSNNYLQIRENIINTIDGWLKDKL